MPGSATSTRSGWAARGSPLPGLKTGGTWDAPVNLPGTVGSNLNTWDPAIAVAPDGPVYASFMVARGDQYYPVVDASFDHGAMFTQSSSLIPPDPKNWGDRDFIAVGPDGAVYVTWDYGPERTSITYICASNGQLRIRDGRPQRRDAEVHRRGQDVEQDVLHQPRLPCQWRGQRAPRG